MWVNDLLRMEMMAECLGKRPAFLVQEKPWSPSSSTFLPQQHLSMNGQYSGIGPKKAISVDLFLYEIKINLLCNNTLDLVK